MDKPIYECAMYVYEMVKVTGKRFAFSVLMISPRSFLGNNNIPFVKVIEASKFINAHKFSEKFPKK